ncbi:MAG: hypothetical protein K2W88_15125 [Pararheinheimera sp.]|nr:hypothetical protein [Rheinheimera sp.]
MGQKEFKMWVLYQNTLDFPGQFVAREFVGGKPTGWCFADAELGPVNNWVVQSAKKFGLGEPVRLERDPNDDPCIVCTFI